MSQNSKPDSDNQDSDYASLVQADAQTETQTQTSRLKKYSKRFLGLIIAFTVIGTILDFVRLQQRDSRQLDTPMISFINSQLSDVQKQQVAEGKPVLIYAWASWCGICKLTSKAVSNISEDYPVVAIALKSGFSSQVNQFLQENGYQFNSYADVNGALSSQLQVKGTPSFYIVDANQSNGEILYYSVGVNTELGLRAKLALFSHQ